MKNTITISILLLSLSGCAINTHYQRVALADKYNEAMSVRLKKKTLLMSSPKGAKIEVGNEYLGRTPMEVNIEALCQKYGSTFGLTIKAIPTLAGSCVQEKYFTCYLETKYVENDFYFSTPSYPSEPPSRTLFEMGLCPVRPGIDVMIHK